MRGRFITLEGGDGAGKSTQSAAILSFLACKNIDVVITREVGGTPSAELIRDLWLHQTDAKWDVMTELYLIMAARREHLVKKIWPALEKGQWVVSDRFVDSTRAYQGIAQGLGLKEVDRAYQQIAGDFWPDKTLILDLPIEMGRKRRSGRAEGEDRFELQDAAFHNTLRQAFLDFAKEEPSRFSVIDATQSAAKVSSDIDKVLQSLIEGV